MSLKLKLEEFKHWLIFGGLIIGFISNWGRLPEELPMLGVWTGKVYGVVIILAGYSYYTFHHSKVMRYGPKKMSYQQTVPSRNISRRLPSHRAQSNVPPKQRYSPPQQQRTPERNNPPSAQDAFATFNKED